MAIERAILTATSALHAGGALFSKQFWSGVRADHVPGSLHFVMMDLEKSTEKEPFSG